MALSSTAIAADSISSASLSTTRKLAALSNGLLLDANKDVFWPLLTLALRADVPFPNPLREADRQTRLRIDYVRVYV
jgi:hypothetical protein